MDKNSMKYIKELETKRKCINKERFIDEVKRFIYKSEYKSEDVEKFEKRITKLKLSNKKGKKQIALLKVKLNKINNCLKKDVQKEIIELTKKAEEIYISICRIEEEVNDIKILLNDDSNPRITIYDLLTLEDMLPMSFNENKNDDLYSTSSKEFINHTIENFKKINIKILKKSDDITDNEIFQDKNTLENIFSKTDHYGTNYEYALAVFISLESSHVFRDGNKRTNLLIFQYLLLLSLGLRQVKITIPNNIRKQYYDKKITKRKYEQIITSIVVNVIKNNDM